MKNKVGMIGVPLGFGAGQTGSQLGVNAMRLTRFRGRQPIDHLQELGFDAVDHGDVDVVNPKPGTDTGNPRYLAEMLASSKNVVDALTTILSRGEFPIILGGDHAIAIPTFSGLSSYYRQKG